MTRVSHITYKETPLWSHLWHEVIEAKLEARGCEAALRSAGGKVFLRGAEAIRQPEKLASPGSYLASLLLLVNMLHHAERYVVVFVIQLFVYTLPCDRKWKSFSTCSGFGYGDNMLFMI